MLNELKQYAKAHQIPIITDDGLLFIKQLISTYHIKHVLEIGTAIGYSAISMTSFGVDVDTIERDLKMIEIAKKHINMSPYPQKVHLIEADAKTYDGPLQHYDMIFIDAAKSQYQVFFEKYQHTLKDHGIILCDNLNFHHLDPQKVNRNTRQLLTKIERFKTFLKENVSFETTFFDIGDGMSVSRKVCK